MKKVNDFFKKTNKKDFAISKSKNVMCEAFDISFSDTKAPVVLILNKVSAEIKIIFPTTGITWDGNIYEMSKELKTTSSDSFIESKLKGYIYKEILKRYHFMFDAKSIEKVHLKYDRTF